jgi:hypothetical protein
MQSGLKPGILDELSLMRRIAMADVVVATLNISI